jgi:glycosyltransferase involved in cell wall biosynthesis
MRWRPSSDGALRVGWAAASTLGARRATFRGLPANVAMRIANTARWIEREARDVRCEMYRPERRYDVVVFFKTMDEAAQAEAARIQRRGGRVVFDANVNYYDVWGDYELPGTLPTAEQRRDAHAMTRLADWVVADSTYLLEIVRRLNPSSSWIPDNVDTRLFRPAARPSARSSPRVVWSGRAGKARPLLDIRDAVAAVGGELVVVSNEPPAELRELQRAVRCRFVRFSLRDYARTLRECDVVVSPKRLVNGYELGHTEWKITLGMAAGLPAVASPQQSYAEAIDHLGGGLVARSPEQWRDALARLAAPELRADLGRRARQTVEERYATPVVARRYLELLHSLR